MHMFEEMSMNTLCCQKSTSVHSCLEWLSQLVVMEELVNDRYRHGCPKQALDGSPGTWPRSRVLCLVCV